MAQAPGTAINEGTYSQQFLEPVMVWPTPTPKQTPVLSSETITERRSVWEPVIREAATRHGVSADLLVRVAECESGFRPDIKNATSTASGLFQYLDSTWASMSARYSVTADKHDGYAQADLTARIVADGGITHWNASRSCWQSAL